MKKLISVSLLIGSVASINAVAEHANSQIAITYSGADRYEAPPAVRPPAPMPPPSQSSRRSRDINVNVTVDGSSPYGGYATVSTSNGGYGSYSGNRYGGSGSYSGPRGHVSFGWQRSPGSYAPSGYAYPPYGYSYSNNSPYYSTYSSGSPYAYNNNGGYPSFSTGSTTYIYRSTPGYNSCGYGGYGYGSGYGSYGGSYSYSRSPGSFQFSGTGPYGGSLNIRALRTSTY